MPRRPAFHPHRPTRRSVFPTAPLLLALFLSALCLAAAPAAAQTGAEAAPSLRPTTLRLKWTHQFQFAGFYAALEQGFYRDAGFDVTIQEGPPDADPVQAVTSGAADFGIGNSALVLSRAEGRPVTAVAVIFQHSPFILLARRGDDLRSIHDLPGKTLMLETHAAELLAYLKMERAPLETMKIVPHSGGVGPLIRGEVDAITAYSTTEPFDLARAGFAYTVFNPRAAGIDFYGDTLFTTEKLAHDEPRTVAAFRAASLKGWRHALAHPDETVELILRRYAPQLGRDKLLFEAREIHRLMLADMVEIGYQYPGRWRHIADSFAAAGLVPAGLSLDGFIFDPDQKPDLTWLYASLAGAGAVIAVGGWLLARFHGLNRQLRSEVASRQLLEEELRRLAATDPLTGLFNRRRFQEAMEREVARARRHGHALALLVGDLDHFKQINDRFGHAAGDNALRLFADICRLCLRSADAVGRMGGEEFAILLPETDAAGAERVAERIRAETAAAAQDRDGDAPPFTISIGVALLAPGDESAERVFARADRALYQAKAEGRNRVAVAPA